MTSFIVRVELHDAGPSDYEELNAAMGAEGFVQSIRGSSATWYRLPTAEYYWKDPGTPEWVFAAAKRAAATAGKRYGVIVTKAGRSLWEGLEPEL